jgi:hypothetical protein
MGRFRDIRLLHRCIVSNGLSIHRLHRVFPERASSTGTHENCNGVAPILGESLPQKLATVFTEDEIWFSLDNPRNQLWIAFVVPRPTRVRRNIGPRKVMIWIYFSRSGSYDVVTLPSGERFNRDFLTNEMLESYDEHRSETRKRTDGMTRFAY